jgi:hypothetical protein
MGLFSKAVKTRGQSHKAFTPGTNLPKVVITRFNLENIWSKVSMDFFRDGIGDLGNLFYSILRHKSVIGLASD